MDISVEDLAAQFTLIDLPIFKSIKRDEFISLGNGRGSGDSGLTSTSTDSSNLNNCQTTTTTKKKNNKQHLCPNVVAMNKQFNQVTFWVVGQILSHDSPRIRAEIISHFIKTAKRLYLLNNLHSSYAVISALLSSPIYRLEKTWHFVKKKHQKELQQFKHLKELFSDNNNYELLRNHLDNCDLPCIPYLGMYSRDIIYINEAHQEGTIQRTKNTTKILESIEKFQSSEYNNLKTIPNVNCCLISNRYIDELQKFVEDENYRRSLELEPPLDSNNYHYNHNTQHHPIILDAQNDNNNNTINNNGGHRHQKRSAMLLASLTSMVQSAVLTTSNKFGGSSPRRTSNDSQEACKYLIDDSFIKPPTNNNHDHTQTNLPPILSSN